MSKEGVTKSDLLEMENRINKEQTQARHQQNNSIQNALLKADEAINENKLLNKTMENMNDKIRKIDEKVDWIWEMMREWFKDLKHELKTWYTPISEHKHNSDRIGRIEKVMYWIAWIIWTAIVTALLSLIITKW